MKKILLIGISVFTVLCAHAQQFWIENWTGATAQGQLTYTGPNGAWSVQQTGTNDVDSNAWYFSNQEEAMGRGQCGTSGGNGTAHMGNTANAPLLGLAGADNGAIIDDGTNTTTNLRLQSPVINCTGKSTIKLSFNYIEGKSAGNDYITVDYFDGATWSLLSTPAELDSCPSQQGHWTYYSVALPASANNNANVRVGFNWTNNTASTDDNTFSNTFVEIVSFAVDSVVLSTPTASAPVTAFTVSDTSICIGDSVQFTDQSTNSPTSWAWTFTGGTPATSALQNPWVKYTAAGYYNVKLKSSNVGGSDSLTKTAYVHVKNCAAGIGSITDNNNISLYPNPANSIVTMTFATAISSSIRVDMTDVAGRLVSTQVLNAVTGKAISMNISGMAPGMYLVKVTDGNNVYFKKFIKQ